MPPGSGAGKKNLLGRLADIVDDAHVFHAPVILTHRDRRAVTVIDAEDLERLAESVEDPADTEVAQAARVEIVEYGIASWNEVKTELGPA